MNYFYNITVYLKCGIYILALTLGNCTSSNNSDFEIKLSAKMDLTVEQIMSLSEEIQRLSQKMNVMQANLSLPQNILPQRRGVSTQVPAPTFSFDLSSSPFQGDSRANIAIVEFTDYECPFCKQHFGTTYKQIMEQYVEQGIARYYIVDFPLDSHAFSFRAAVAAKCADEQGKYWEYHDKLFGIRSSLQNDTFDEVSESIGIEAPKFTECMKLPEHQARIETMRTKAADIGVTGTPTFLIGKLNSEHFLEDGVLLKGARSFSSFQDIVTLLRI